MHVSFAAALALPIGCSGFDWEFYDESRDEFATKLHQTGRSLSDLVQNQPNQ